jgi:hypothetical protein
MKDHVQQTFAKQTIIWAGTINCVAAASTVQRRSISGGRRMGAVTVQRAGAERTSNYFRLTKPARKS